MALQRKVRSKRKVEPVVQATVDANALPSDRTAAAALIESWLNDSSGYDEAVWPILQAEIEANRPARRARFHD